MDVSNVLQDKNSSPDQYFLCNLSKKDAFAEKHVAIFAVCSSCTPPACTVIGLGTLGERFLLICFCISLWSIVHEFVLLFNLMIQSALGIEADLLHAM